MKNNNSNIGPDLGIEKLLKKHSIPQGLSKDTLSIDNQNNEKIEKDDEDITQKQLAKLTEKYLNTPKKDTLNIEQHFSNSQQKTNNDLNTKPLFQFQTIPSLTSFEKLKNELKWLNEQINNSILPPSIHSAAVKSLTDFIEEDISLFNQALNDKKLLTLIENILNNIKQQLLKENNIEELIVFVERLTKINPAYYKELIDIYQKKIKVIQDKPDYKTTDSYHEAVNELKEKIQLIQEKYVNLKDNTINKTPNQNSQTSQIPFTKKRKNTSTYNPFLSKKSLAISMILTIVLLFIYYLYFIPSTIPTKISTPIYLSKIEFKKNYILKPLKRTPLTSLSQVFYLLTEKRSKHSSKGNSTLPLTINNNKKATTAKPAKPKEEINTSSPIEPPDFWTKVTSQRKQRTKSSSVFEKDFVTKGYSSTEDNISTDKIINTQTTSQKNSFKYYNIITACPVVTKPKYIAPIVSYLKVGDKVKVSRIVDKRWLEIISHNGKKGYILKQNATPAWNY